MSSQQRRTHAATVGLLSSLAACASPEYEPQPIDALRAVEDFSARSLTAPELAAFARTRWPGGEAFPPATWGLEALTLAAFFRRGELDIERAKLALRRAAEATAGQRPNPTLSFDPEIVPGTSEPWILGFQLDLTLETAGKRDLRVRAAEERSRGAEIELYAAAWRVRSEVRAALVDELAARAEQQALAAVIEAREAQRATLSAQLSAGRISRFELAEVERELARLELERAALKARGENALAALARALGVPRAALDSIAIADPLLDDLPDAPATLAARDLGLTGRLDLRAGLIDYARAEAELALEIARAVPDLHLGPGYHWDQGDHKFMLGLAFELPLFHRNEGPIAEARAARTEAEARFLALQEDAIGAIEQARVRYAGTLEESQAARAALAAALERETRQERALEAGASDRPALLAARVERLELERERVRRGAEASRNLGALEDELQRPLAHAFDPAPVAGRGDDGS